MTTAENSLPPISGMSQLAGSALVVTGFGLATQAIGFIVQIFVAAIFGAKADMDAFLAASTLPQYAISVFVGSLGYVFIPVLSNYVAKGREEEGRRFAYGVLNLSVFVFGGVAVFCMIFAEPLLRLTTPGLNPESLKLAARLARIIWPTIMVFSAVGVLTGIYQTHHRFGWPAAVPALGALAYLSLFLILSRPFGIAGLAIANATGVAVQMILLLPIILSRKWRYRPVLDWHAPGLHQMCCLLIPLILVSFVTKCSTLVERYLASELPLGSISHLGYAFRPISFLVLILSTGITTAIFPKIALNGAIGDIATLRRTMSISLRMMWLLVVPVIVIGAILSFPLVTAVFFRGQFNPNDVVSVAGLLRIYLISLVGACLGGITGRVFYALKDTRTVGIVGSIETVAYVIYTAVLAKRFGVAGIAWGYVFYFNISILWQLFVLRYKLGRKGGSTVLSSFVRMGLAGLIAGLTAYAGMQSVSNAWMQLLFGGIAGFAVYIVALKLLRSNEIEQIWNICVGHIQMLKRIRY